MEIQDSILILDELKGRKIAERLNLKFSGTFGVILKAKQTGLIKSVKPVIDKMKLTDFRFSDLLENFPLFTPASNGSARLHFFLTDN
jgi:predicted nucleic acid-binding protein